MDTTAFEIDALDDIHGGTFTWQGVTLDGAVVTIGETWQGALYGLEENGYGQRALHRFDTEDEQRAWFDAVTGA